MKEIGKVFADKFKDAGITKVVTIEASGIAPALYTADALGVPMIFAKKSKNITMNEGTPYRWSLLLYKTSHKYSFLSQVSIFPNRIKSSLSMIPSEWTSR